MFEINDSDNEASEETKKRICGLCEELLSVIDDINPTPLEAVQSICAVAAFILCEHSPSREGANGALARMLVSISETLNQAELDGNVAWNLKSKH